MTTDYHTGTCNRCGHAPCICDTTTIDYYQVLPLAPQPESTTTVTGIPIDYSYTPCYGTHGNKGKVVGECAKCHQLLYEEKRTPQKHRQYWAVMKAVIGQGGMIRSKRGLQRLMDEIEEWVG